MDHTPLLGTARKMAIGTITASVLGWLIFVILQNQEDSGHSKFYPLWAGSVITPIVYMGALIHAVLWGKWSSVAGAVTGFLSIFSFTAIGRELYQLGVEIYLSGLLHPMGVHSQTETYSFSGALISCIFWALTISLWPFFTYSKESSETWADRHALFHGVARKAALPVILFSAIGWLLTVTSFGVSNYHVSKPSGNLPFPTDFPYWTIIFLGPFVYVGAIAHAGLWKRQSSIAGAITAFLSILYFTAIGFVLVRSGTSVFDEYDAYVPPWISLQLAGTSISTFFWAIAMVLWPFYTNQQGSYTLLQNINDYT